MAYAGYEHVAAGLRYHALGRASWFLDCRLTHLFPHGQVEAVDDEAREQKKKTMPFLEVHALAFGFKRLAKIDCLSGLQNLAKLQLDNNNISKIENLDKLVRFQLAAFGALLPLIAVHFQCARWSAS